MAEEPVGRPSLPVISQAPADVARRGGHQSLSCSRVIMGFNVSVRKYAHIEGVCRRWDSGHQ